MTGAILRPGQAELPTTGSTHSYWHKEPSEALLGHRTTEQLPATTDVVVIGSGITGAFAARELVAGGKGVVMIEAREACWGATGRVSLLLRLTHVILMGLTLKKCSFRTCAERRSLSASGPSKRAIGCALRTRYVSLSR